MDQGGKMPMYGSRNVQITRYIPNTMPINPYLYFNSPVRQQPFAYNSMMQGIPGMNWNLMGDSHSQQNTQVLQQMNPYYSQYQSYQGYQIPTQNQKMSYSQAVLQNPLHLEEDYYVTNQSQASLNGYPTMNPYPKGSLHPKQPSGMKSVLNSFKSQDGSLDINKMIDTAGQMMNAVSQVSSVVKGLGGMFKA
jgi:hypothetical protein